jgi:hypothetical protein
VSRKAVSLWVHHALQGVDVLEKKPIVRPALMSWEAAKTACDLVTTNKVQTLEGAAEELHSRGLTSRILHPTTVAKHAKAYAKATHWSSLLAGLGKARGQVYCQSTTP